MTRFFTTSALAVALGACGLSAPLPTGLILPPDETFPLQGATGTGRCSNTGLDQFKNRPATTEVASQMLRVTGARRIRWATPGTAMTMEFSPDRLTVHLNASNRIDRAICG